jgi:uncharacterized membrane protein SpoIIM required for sporulation
MKDPDHFAHNLLLVTLVLLLGIGIVVLETVVTRSDLAPYNATELNEQYLFHASVVVPRMTHVYPQLLFSNAGVALFILIVPLYWVWIWWFRRDLLPLVLSLMQGTVFVLVAALGHNSFTKAWAWYKTLPAGVVATLYYPHGVLEMVAFILAGTFSLLCIRDLGKYLRTTGEVPALHFGEIPLFIARRTWKVFLAILALLAVAAAIECYLTPLMVKSAYEAAMAGMQL